MIDYSIYIEATCCDSTGYIRKVIDKMPLIDDELIEKFLRKCRKYYTVITWEILLLPKRYTINSVKGVKK